MLQNGNCNSAALLTRSSLPTHSKLVSRRQMHCVWAIFVLWHQKKNWRITLCVHQYFRISFDCTHRTHWFSLKMPFCLDFTANDSSLCKQNKSHRVQRAPNSTNPGVEYYEYGNFLFVMSLTCSGAHSLSRSRPFAGAEWNQDLCVFDFPLFALCATNEIPLFPWHNIGVEANVPGGRFGD